MGSLWEVDLFFGNLPTTSHTFYGKFMGSYGKLWEPSHNFPHFLWEVYGKFMGSCGNSHNQWEVCGKFVGSRRKFPDLALLHLAHFGIFWSVLKLVGTCGKVPTRFVGSCGKFVGSCGKFVGSLWEVVGSFMGSSLKKSVWLLSCLVH